MKIYLLNDCPFCEAPVSGQGSNFTNMDEWDEKLHLPLPENFDKFLGARFSICKNRHYFNVRPYADYDEHYVTKEKLEEKLAYHKECYEALQRLDRRREVSE